MQENYTDADNDYRSLGRETVKWKTLSHNGVVFAPQYVPCKIPIIIEGREVVLNAEAEEFLYYYVHSRYDKYRNKSFADNFFRDLSAIAKISSSKLRAANIDRLKEHAARVTEDIKKERESMTKEEKERKKKEREAIVEKYGFVIVDGEKQAIDNFIVEPPSIFIGRGDHPLAGSIKKRLMPEDVTINISKKSTVPIPIVDGVEHKWGSVVHEPTLEWVASWRNNVTQKVKYIRFGRKSTFKMSSDERKYEMARKLKKNIDTVRKKIIKDMGSDDEVLRQKATCLWLIDVLVIRVGNEKKETEAETTGASTLKAKHVSITEKGTILFSFLGKDSVKYQKEIIPTNIVNQNIALFLKDKKPEDPLFDLVSSASVNDYIRSFSSDLTSKVFRTYNASNLMINELAKIKSGLSIDCLLYTSPSPRDGLLSRMPSSA